MATAPLPYAGLAAAAATVIGITGRVAGVIGLAGAPAMVRSSAELGVTVAASGITPALLISARTSRAWAGVCKVTTTPSAPALAVRPDRCR